MSMSQSTEDDRADEISEVDEEVVVPAASSVHIRDPFGVKRFADFDFDRHFVVKLIDEGSEALSALGKASVPKEPEVTQPEDHGPSPDRTYIKSDEENSGDTGLNLFNVITSNIPRLYSVKEQGTSSFNLNGANRKSITDSRNIQHECVRQPWSNLKTARRKSDLKNDGVMKFTTEDDRFNAGFWKPLERPLKSLKFKAGGDTITRAVTANPHLFATKTVQTELTSSERPTTPSLDPEYQKNTKKDKPEPKSNTTTTDTRPKTTGSMIPYPYFAKPALGSSNRFGKAPNFMALDSNCNAWGQLGSQKTLEAERSILSTCAQRQPIPIQLMVEYLLNIKKIGEGVYGEVYKGYHKGGTELRVFKIIPIEGSKLVNGEKQKKFHEVEPEIIVAQEVNKLRKGIRGCQTDGHSKLIQAKICVGSYPEMLTQQWKAWHKIHVSQNDLPKFDQNQLYAMLEFDFHGYDVETYKFRNAKQAFAVLLNVVYTLAASEVGIQFEHRDLHWGNILVLRTRERASCYTIKGDVFRVPNCGLKTTLIDYTISRVTNSTNGEAVFTDLANDEDQFCGSEEYQFEIYRMMRKKNNNNWKPFCPKSNVYWIHYFAGKLIEKARYQEPTSGIHYYYKNKLLRIQAGILKYESCWDCVQNFLGPFVREIEHDG